MECQTLPSRQRLRDEQPLPREHRVVGGGGVLVGAAVVDLHLVQGKQARVPSAAAPGVTASSVVVSCDRDLVTRGRTGHAGHVELEREVLRRLRGRALAVGEPHLRRGAQLARVFGQVRECASRSRA